MKRFFRSSKFIDNEHDFVDDFHLSEILEEHFDGFLYEFHKLRRFHISFRIECQLQRSKEIKEENILGKYSFSLLAEIFTFWSFDRKFIVIRHFFNKLDDFIE